MFVFLFGQAPRCVEGKADRERHLPDSWRTWTKLPLTICEQLIFDVLMQFFWVFIHVELLSKLLISDRYHLVKFLENLLVLQISLSCFQMSLHKKGIQLKDNISYWPHNRLAKRRQHVIVTEESNKLTILPNFFRFWLFWPLPLELFGVQMTYYSFIFIYDPFEQIWIAEIV